MSPPAFANGQTPIERITGREAGVDSIEVVPARSPRNLTFQLTSLRNNGCVRHVSLLLLLAAAACSSSPGMQTNLIEGGPGQAITVDINSVDNSVSLPDPDRSRQFTVQVEVGNSTDALLTVTQISIRTEGNGAFQVYPAVKRFNELIDPRKDHLFEMIVRGRFVRAFAANEAHTVVLGVIVTLSNGDSYEYSFEGPVLEESP